MQTRRPSREPNFSRSVYISRRPWVGRGFPGRKRRYPKSAKALLCSFPLDQGDAGWKASSCRPSFHSISTALIVNVVQKDAIFAIGLAHQDFDFLLQRGWDTFSHKIRLD